MKKIKKPEDRLAWLEWRQGGIGGSDISGILNLDKYNTPIKIYEAKVCAPKVGEDNEAMEIGRAIEPWLLERFTAKTGLKVTTSEHMFVSDDWSRAFANVDGIITENGEDGILECKNNGEYKKAEWEKETGPISYYYQLQWYLYVTGYKFGYLFALVGGNHHEVKRIDRNEGVIELMVTAAKMFWEDSVVKRIPPPPDGSEFYSNFIKEMFPQAVVKSVDLSDVSHLYKELEDAKVQVKAADAQLELCKQRIQVLMKDADCASFGLDLSGKPMKITWRSQSATRFDTKAFEKDHAELYNMYKKESSFRVFRG